MNVVLIASVCGAVALIGRTVYSRHPSGARLSEAVREIELQRKRLGVVAAAQRGIFADGVDRERVLLSVATWALAIVDCDAALIATPDGDELVYRSVVGGPSTLVGMRVAIAGSPNGRCLLTNTPVVWSDASAGAELMRQLDVRSCLSVPLLSADRSIPVGVLEVHSSRQLAFDDDDIAALTVISHVIASGVGDPPRGRAPRVAWCGPGWFGW